MTCATIISLSILCNIFQKVLYFNNIFLLSAVLQYKLSNDLRYDYFFKYTVKYFLETVVF